MPKQKELLSVRALEIMAAIYTDLPIYPTGPKRTSKFREFDLDWNDDKSTIHICLFTRSLGPFISENHDLARVDHCVSNSRSLQPHGLSATDCRPAGGCSTADPSEPSGPASCCGKLTSWGSFKQYKGAEEAFNHSHKFLAPPVYSDCGSAILSS